MRSPSKRLLSTDSAMRESDQPPRKTPVPAAEQPIAREPQSKHSEERELFLAGDGSTGPPAAFAHHRAETLPDKLETATPNLASPQHIVNVLEAHPEEVLILDLRVSTQYARSCVRAALNLCVPTTLLKRPSYNVGRLTDTFKNDAQKTQFEKWETCNYIVVYDANTSQIKDAANCLNVLKKFTNEGWIGNAYIVRGGFAEFSSKFPDWVDQGDEAVSSTGIGKPTLNLQLGDKKIAPVIGGCPMPMTKSAANPFFGNIRQNMDLIGGVGQMDVRYPAAMTSEQKSVIPAWLKRAASASDEGKGVSDKFLNIEKGEQKRMQDALSGNVSYGTPTPGATRKVQIAGIEKGSKNRYNNIWPYEHSRVKLQGVKKDDCDYVNASHISTSRSKKHYISTQAPIPATFGDFWNMVWQRDIRVIVMLTAEAEGGQIKAHNYWQDGQYGHCTLTFHSEHRASLEMSRITKHRKRPSMGKQKSSMKIVPRPSSNDNPFEAAMGGNKSDETIAPGEQDDAPHVIVRRFTLANESKPFERIREITQLQYSNWPDFGAPAHPAHLLGLVEQCDAVVQASRGGSSLQAREGPDEDERPVLVHCSAGCGRTGTFCTVDSVVDMLKAQRKSRSSKRDASPMDLDPPGWQAGKDGKDENPFFSGDGGDGSLSLSSIKAVTPSSTPSDMKKEWLGLDDVDLIEKTVEELRLQRISMVQSLRQYVLCYEAVLEWIAHQDNM